MAVHPIRKHPRLKEYDYSNNGYCFVTICCHEMKCYFGNVGRGLAPAEQNIALSEYGKIAKEQLLDLEKRFPFIKIDKYVIMPNHIHFIITFDDYVSDEKITAGASPRPTLMDVMCVYKSLTARLCNKKSHITGRKIFQTSFYEKVVRSEKSYQEVWQYIDENVLKWKLDKYYK